MKNTKKMIAGGRETGLYIQNATPAIQERMDHWPEREKSPH